MPASSHAFEGSDRAAWRSLLGALWLSLALHGALVAIVQVRPPSGSGTERLIEAWLEWPADAVASLDVSTLAVADLLPELTEVHSPASPMPDTASPDHQQQEDHPPSRDDGDGQPPVEAQGMPQPVPPSAPEPVAGPAPVAVATPSSAPPAAPATLPTVEIPLAPDPTYYSAREVDVHPAPMHPIVPQYPDAARRAGKHGRVTVLLHIEADGRVSDAEVIHAEHPDVFDEAALEPFRKSWFRFYPAKKNGRPVRARVKLEVHFYDPRGAP